MAIRGVLRIGEAAIRVLDLEEAVVHYRDRIGLREVMRDDAGRAYLKAWDEHDHHSLVLREADRPGLDYLAYKVYDDQALTEFERRIKDDGIAVSQIAAGSIPKSGRRIQFQLPSGHTFQLYAEKERIGNGIATHNPTVLPEEGAIRGMAPTRLDHALIYGPEVPEVQRFFVEVLDFEMTEVIRSESGDMVSAFLSCSNKAHDIAIINYPEPGKLHHISFNLESVQDIYHAADLMGTHGISVDLGPTRHGITRGATIYFFDPSGNRNEVFAGGYIRYPDMPLLTWDESQLGPAVFYPDRKLNENFLSVVT